MELRQIQYFVQLYKDCNMTKSSQALYISQQGLSKSVSKLEAELGFSLFRRTSSGVTPTESADKLFEFFKKVLDSYQELQREIASVHQKRVLKIIASPGFALATDTDEFAEYGKLYPEFETMYVEEPKELMVQSMLEGKGDIAYMVPPIPEEFQSHQIVGREPLYVAVHHTHPLAGKEKVTITDLEGCHLLLLNLYEGHNGWILRHAEHLGISYSVYNQVALNEFLSILCAREELAGFSSKLLYRYYNFPGITFLPFFLEDGSQMYIETHLVTLKGVYPDRETQHYIDYAKEKCGGAFPEAAPGAGAVPFQEISPKNGHGPLFHSS